jgi:hypothetical protein
MKSRIGDRYQKNTDKCDICFCNYDRNSHAPVESNPSAFCMETIRRDTVTATTSLNCYQERDNRMENTAVLKIKKPRPFGC